MMVIFTIYKIKVKVKVKFKAILINQMADFLSFLGNFLISHF